MPSVPIGTTSFAPVLTPWLPIRQNGNLFLDEPLRQILPDARQFIQADEETVQWQPDASYRLDVAEFEQAASGNQRGDLEKAVALYRGDLLPGCYDDWLLPDRERLRHLFTATVERLLPLLEAQGVIRSAIGYAQRLIHHDPLHEPAYRWLMRLYALTGDRAGAQRIYHACVEVLERELGTPPSPVTRETYERIKDEGWEPGSLTTADLARLWGRGTAPRHNLPHPLTSFIGREPEISEVKRLLNTTRLLTLTGSGGCGKTRLALEVGFDLVDDHAYTDGVWWVELAGLADPALVPQAVATALGVRDQPGRTLFEVLTDYFRSRHLLLVLDNCEHLLEASAPLADGWLKVCPQLRILATSRETLNISGETTWRVPSLTVPQLGDPGVEKMAHLEQFESVRLFVARAGAALPSFSLAEGNAVAVAQVCVRLDGMPLAIELAAARVRGLSVEQIAVRLDDALKLLTGGSRTALPRNRTLQASIEWSYASLSPAEQRLLQWLAVFHGGWTVGAAEMVAQEPGGGAAPYQVLDYLLRLVDKSLVDVDERDGEMRYRMLETIRQYAWEKLSASGEGAIAQNRHLAYYLDLAERAEPELHGKHQVVWWNRLEVELDNLRAALQWSLTPQNIDLGLRLAGALWWFWYLRDHLGEGIGWMERVIKFHEAQAIESSGAAAPSVASVKLLSQLAILSVLFGELRSAGIQAREAVTLSRKIGDRRNLAFSLFAMGCEAASTNHLEQSRGLCEESLALFKELNEIWYSGVTIYALGVTAWYNSENTLAETRFIECLPIFQKLGDKWGFALTWQLLGCVAREQGDFTQADMRLQQSLLLFQELGHKGGVVLAFFQLGVSAYRQKDYQRAILLLQQASIIAQETGDIFNSPDIPMCLAIVAVVQGQLEKAARLLGVVERIKEKSGAPIVALFRHDYIQAMDMLQTKMQEDDIAAAWKAGLAMTVEEAIVYASA